MACKPTLNSLFSTDINFPLRKWNPPNEEVYISLNIDLSFSCDESVFYFYSRLATPDALITRLKKNEEPQFISANRMIILSKFDYNLLENEVNKILDKCTRDDVGKTCLALERYFQWEYEDWEG